MILGQDLRMRAGAFALNASIEVRDGEYFVLLGMTGSGKTLLLEALCGLRRLDGGRVSINGRDVTRLDPRRRRIGYVPQDGVLFEHLNVAANIGFALRVAGLPRRRVLERAAEIAANIGIAHLLNRRIRGLSGGERQRVALSRALAGDPDVLFLDEPVSALDEFTREGVCRELKRLQRDLGVSVIHVCHSFEEARLVGDRIGVLVAGRMVQAGTADEILHSPADVDVARILRLDNVFEGTSDGLGNLMAAGVTIMGTPAPVGPVTFLVRPWQVRLTTPDAVVSAANRIVGVVAEIVPDSFASRIRLSGPLALSGFVPNDILNGSGWRPGIPIAAEFGPDAIHVFPPPD